MIRKLIFAAGAGIGYVLGTRAGRQKYDAMVAKAREVMERPDVKDVAGAIQGQANKIYDQGRDVVQARVREMRSRTRGRDSDGADAALRHNQAELDSLTETR